MIIKNVGGQKDILDRKLSKKPILTFTCPKSGCRTLSRMDQDTDNVDAEKIPLSWRTDEWVMEDIREGGDVHGQVMIQISSVCPECRWFVRDYYSMMDMFEFMLGMKMDLAGHLSVMGLHNE